MMQPVYFKQTYRSQFGELWDYGLRELIELAIENVDVAKVEAVYVGNMLAAVLAKQSHLAAVIAEVIGRDLPVVAVDSACASSGVATWQAWQSIRSGVFKNVLVLGVEKMTDWSNCEVTAGLAQAADYEREVAVGGSMPNLFGMVTRAYLDKYNLDSEVFAGHPVYAHRMGAKDEKAQYRKEISVETVAKSPDVNDGLKLFHCAPITDGVAAVVLTSEVDESLGIELKWVEYLAGSKFALANREELTSFEVVCKAMANLLAKTGVKVEDFDLLEMHDCFTVAIVIALEDLGFLPKGKGWDLESLKVPFNLHGGLKAGGHPVGATGIRQLVSLVELMQADSTYKNSLAHNVGGVGASVVLSYLQSNRD